MNSEPTIFIEFARTAMFLLTAFGIVLTQDQQTAILAFIPAILAIVSFALAWFNRSKVFSPDTTQAIANAATQLPAGTPVEIGEPPKGNA